MTNAARAYLDSQNFIEIHSPKLQGCFTESGASVFQVDYFQRAAFLAQSPQLAKEMSIGADFERVYEIGPVFRAENSTSISSAPRGRQLSVCLRQATPIAT